MPEIDVLCVGDLDVDMFISVPVVPGFDQKIAGHNHGQKPGGMSANCAVAVSRLGHASRLIAAVGTDQAGKFAISGLARAGVDVDFVAHREGVDTFMCLVLLSPSGEKSLIRLETAAYLPLPGDLNPRAFDGVRHLHITFGSPDLSLAALTIAAERGISTSLDLEPPDMARNPKMLRQILPLVDTLFLNREAYDGAAGILGNSISPADLRGDGEVIVTLGSEGCRRIGADGAIDSAGFEVAPVDTTGAGDCFAGAYLVARLSGKSIRDALEFANAAAALATLEYGAQAAMPSRSQVEAFIVTCRSGSAEPDNLTRGTMIA